MNELVIHFQKLGNVTGMSLFSCRMYGTSSLRRQEGDPWLRTGERLWLPSCAPIRWFKFPLKCGAFKPRLKILFKGYHFS